MDKTVFTNHRHVNKVVHRVTEGTARWGRTPPIEIEFSNGRIFRQEDGADLISVENGVATHLQGCRLEEFTRAGKRHFMSPRDNYDQGVVRVLHYGEGGQVDGQQDLYADGSGKVGIAGPDGRIAGGHKVEYLTDGDVRAFGCGQEVGSDLLDKLHNAHSSLLDRLTRSDRIPEDRWPAHHGEGYGSMKAEDTSVTIYNPISKQSFELPLLFSPASLGAQFHPYEPPQVPWPPQYD